MGTEFQGYANTCDIQYNNTHFTQVCDSSAEEVGTLAHKRCSISSVETVVGTLANSRSSIPFSCFQIRLAVCLFSAAVVDTVANTTTITGFNNSAFALV